MVKRTDLILSVGMLVLVLLALALLGATGSTGEFIGWAWERHHNVLSWYIRPLFFLPFYFFAHNLRPSPTRLTRRASRAGRAPPATPSAPRPDRAAPVGSPD